ncbi:MAG: hypothetical protein M9951_14545 [Burkholderiaceae bacterium]|nr:hypothetical protein [Burkholderiaceae bacterium]
MARPTGAVAWRHASGHPWNRVWTRRAALATVGALAISVAACGIRIGSFEMRFGTIDESLDSGISVAWTVVVRSGSEWARLWQDHEARMTASRPLPLVNFGRDIVVGVFLGQRPDRCHRVRIERVQLIDDSRLIVRYREIVARSDAACAPATSYPAAIARVPLTDLPVHFERMGTLYLD